MPRASLRLLSTTDLIGSFFPQQTSDGCLLGAGALRYRIDELRAERPASLWIDTGDLAQGCALGPLSDGVFGFLALRELTIDAATIGNHELDWGLEHLQRWSRELPFPLLAANADLGFPATTILTPGDWRVGVIGVTYPHMPVLHPNVTVHPDPVALVRDHARALRRERCDLVVLALHDGVDRLPVGSGDGIETGRVAELCASVASDVDVVLGGHTLGGYVGELGGVPFVQPWPFASQVGVVDVLASGEIALDTVDVSTPRPWTGIGVEAQAALEQQIVGRLTAPLACDRSGDLSLAQAIADGVVALDPSVDLTVIAQWDIWNQSPRNGTTAYLPAGDVSMAQVLRLTPMTGARSAWGGQLLTAEISGDSARKLIETIATRPYFPGGPTATSAAIAGEPSKATVRIAIPPFYAARCEPILGRSVNWNRCQTTWRDGLLHALGGTGSNGRL